MIDLSRASRNTDPAVLKDIPGPGYYTSPSPKQVGSHIFGRSERAVSDLSSKIYEDIPGPGAYVQSSISTIPSFKTPFGSSSQRFSSFECKWKPGPGAYYQGAKAEKNQQKVVQTLCIHPSPVPASIPQLERHELAIYDGESQKVSPAEYEPRIENVKPRNPASLFSKSKMPRLPNRNPAFDNLGPGVYYTGQTEKTKHAKNLSQEERFKEEKRIQPGPGDYEPSIQITKPSIPGCYVSKLERKFNIAKQIVQEFPVRRRKANEKYVPSAVFVSSSERDCNRVYETDPVGPGRYEDTPMKAEGYTFSSEPRFKGKEESPVGPGTYDPKSSSKRSSPVHFKSPRFKELSDLYVHSIGDKSVPGPGDYNLRPKWNVRNHGVSFELTSSRHFDRKKSHSPDPGQYHTDLQYNTGHRIGGDSRFKPGNGSYIQSIGSGEIVGPGSYKQKVSMVKRTHNISWI